MKVSFVIPAFNAVTWLPHAVQSCLEQTYPNIEIIPVDDGSTDKTREYLAWAEKDMRVKPVYLGKNFGRSEARNYGNKFATGELICVLDADDIATPNRAELMVKKYKACGADYIYGAAQVMDVIGHPFNVIAPDTVSLAKVIANPSHHVGIVHSTACYTKEFALKYPHLSGEPARLGIDDFCQQVQALADGAKFDFVPQRLCGYRILSQSVTMTRNLDEVLEFKKKFLAGLQVPV